MTQPPTLSDPRAAQLAQHVSACFADIAATRMSGIPILNPALQVEVVGIRQWRQEWLCAVLTPWFLSLVLLPAHEDEAAAAHAIVPGAGAAAIGSKETVRFPAGAFEFIQSYEPAIGHFRTCSLFSPVLEFQDQETAVATAIAALEALLDDGAAEADAEDEGMAMIWRGERPSVADATPIEGEGAKVAKAADLGAEAEIGRRSFLFGRGAKEPGDRR